MISIWKAFTGKLARIVRTGLRSTLERQISRYVWYRFEQRLELDTDGSLDQHQLGVNDRGFGYQPIDYLTLRKAFRHLPKDLSNQSFVDFGCGKGRAMVFAAMQGFDAVWGVEFNQELSKTAEQNLARVQKYRQCRFHRVVHSDATEFALPDEATILFFYNPFGGDILRETLENIRRSIEKKPRTLTIVYALPKFDEDLMAETEWLENVAEVRTCNSDWERLTIYRSRQLVVPNNIGHDAGCHDSGCYDSGCYDSGCYDSGCYDSGSACQDQTCNDQESFDAIEEDAPHAH